MNGHPVDVLAVKPVVIDWMRAIADKDAAYQRANALDHAINGVGLLFAERDAAVAELIESARALRSAHRAFQDWKAQAPKVYPAPRSILEMNAGAKARLFAALDRVGGAA